MQKASETAEDRKKRLDHHDFGHGAKSGECGRHPHVVKSKEESADDLLGAELLAAERAHKKALHQHHQKHEQQHGVAH